MIKRRFFLNFEQLGGPAAKNPIRACARILLSDQNITVGCNCVVVEEHMKVWLVQSLANHFTQKF